MASLRIQASKEGQKVSDKWIFCVGCEPTDSEEIRAYRQERADRKADRYDEWAGKREVKAEAALNSYPSIRHDWAFITQPGHIPFRERMNRADERACESLKVAERMRGKADSLRHVRVAGDADRKREAIRATIKPTLAPGVRVSSPMWGMGTIVKVNAKTAKMAIDRLNGKAYNEPIEWLTVVHSHDFSLQADDSRRCACGEVAQS